MEPKIFYQVGQMGQLPILMKHLVKTLPPPLSSCQRSYLWLVGLDQVSHLLGCRWAFELKVRPALVHLDQLDPNERLGLRPRPYLFVSMKK